MERKRREVRREIPGHRECVIAIAEAGNAWDGASALKPGLSENASVDTKCR